MFASDSKFKNTGMYSANSTLIISTNMLDKHDY